MRIYTYIVFVLQLLAIGNFLWVHASKGWDQLVPLVVGMYYIPAVVVLALVLFGLEFKYSNKAGIYKYATKVLAVVIVLWSVVIIVITR